MENLLNSNLAEFQFEKTPFMSTYLVAYIIGEYDFVECTDANDTVIRVYTPIGKSKMGNFSLDVQ